MATKKYIIAWGHGYPNAENHEIHEREWFKTNNGFTETDLKRIDLLKPGLCADISGYLGFCSVVCISA